MTHTDNYKKHTAKPSVYKFQFLQRFLVDNFFKVLIEQAKEIHPKTILDVGCGEGFTLEKLRLAKIGKNLQGIDFSEKAIEIGKVIHPNLDLKRGDIYKLPYKDNSFDLVICSEVLEHLDEPELALKELARVSKKHLLLSVPNEPLFRLGNFLRGKNIARFGNDIEHIQQWSSSSFRKFVEKDFRIETLVTPLPWTLVVAEKPRTI